MKPSHFMVAFLMGGIAVSGVIGDWRMASLLLTFLVIVIGVIAMKSVVLTERPERPDRRRGFPVLPARRLPEEHSEDPNT